MAGVAVLIGAFAMILSAEPMAAAPQHEWMIHAYRENGTLRYAPSTVEVFPGSPVVLGHIFGEARHSITSPDGFFNSTGNASSWPRILAPNEPGSYRFYCWIHANATTDPSQGMAGVLKVVAEGPASAAAGGDVPGPRGIPGAAAVIVMVLLVCAARFRRGLAPLTLAFVVLAAPAVKAASDATIGTQENGYDLQFDPQRTVVDVGAAVDFRPSERFAHTLTSNQSGLFDTGRTEPGETKAFTAPRSPGTYPFHCSFHPQMYGSLEVVQGDSSKESPSPTGVPIAGAIVLAFFVKRTLRRGPSDH